MFCLSCGNKLCNCKVSVQGQFQPQETIVVKEDNNTVKVTLTNGMVIRAVQSISSTNRSIVDIYLINKDGTHVAAKTFSYRSFSQKIEKMAKAIRDIKIEIVSQEVTEFAKLASRTIPELLDFINKRVEDLEVKKAA